MTAENCVLILCRLLAAWIHGTAPEAVEIPDYEALFQTASRHLLTAAACAALEATDRMADCPPETAKRFREAKAIAIRRTILMDAERKELLAHFEQSGIWYAPIKGVVLNALYPQYGVRQFSDNDILFDVKCDRTVRNYMKSRGYAVETFRLGPHDSYQKPPVYRFEMHRRLFAENEERGVTTACAAYYENVRERLRKDEGNRCGYHFGAEDFYVYFLAHAYKHYSAGGTGLRTLLDVYLYRRSRPEMDAEYIRGELRKLGLTEFEAVCRSLAEKRFGPAPCPELTEKEREMSEWIESSGVYGTAAHRIRVKLFKIQGGGGPVTARTRAKYLFRRIFPGWNWYRVYAPFVYRHRWTVPFFWTYRLCRGVLKNGRRNLREAGAVCTYREE